MENERSLEALHERSFEAHLEDLEECFQQLEDVTTSSTLGSVLVKDPLGPLSALGQVLDEENIEHIGDHNSKDNNHDASAAATPASTSNSTSAFSTTNVDPNVLFQLPLGSVPMALVSADDVASIMTTADGYKVNPNTAFGDSAATSHMGPSDVGMFDWEHCNEPVKIGDGKALMVTKKGKRQVRVVQADGTKQEAVLDDYKYVR